MVKSYSALSVLTGRRGSCGGACIDHGPYQTYRSRRKAEQPEKYQPGDSQKFADGDNRPVRVRKVVVGVRHDLRRGPAPLCGVFIRVRTAVPRPDGAPGSGRNRRAFAFDCHRAKDNDAIAAIHSRHHYRNLRLSARGVCLGRRAALPELRKAHQAPVERSNRSGHSWRRTEQDG